MMGISHTIWEQVVVSLIVLLLLAGATYLINRYYGSDFESYYDIQDIKLPLTLSSPKIEKSSVLTLILNNHTDKTIRVLSIKVYGLNRFDGARLFDFAYDDADHQEKLQTQILEGGVLMVTNISPFDPKRRRVLYIWGSFLTTSVVITNDRGTYVSDDAMKVSGVEKLFARYWKLNALIIAFIAFLSFYFGKLRKS